MALRFGLAMCPGEQIDPPGMAKINHAPVCQMHLIRESFVYVG